MSDAMDKACEGATQVDEVLDRVERQAGRLEKLIEKIINGTYCREVIEQGLALRRLVSASRDDVNDERRRQVDDLAAQWVVLTKGGHLAKCSEIQDEVSACFSTVEACLKSLQGLSQLVLAMVVGQEHLIGALFGDERAAAVKTVVGWVAARKTTVGVTTAAGTTDDESKLSATFRRAEELVSADGACGALRVAVEPVALAMEVLLKLIKELEATSTPSTAEITIAMAKANGSNEARPRPPPPIVVPGWDTHSDVSCPCCNCQNSPCTILATPFPYATMPVPPTFDAAEVEASVVTANDSLTASVFTACAVIAAVAAAVAAAVIAAVIAAGEL